MLRRGRTGSLIPALLMLGCFLPAPAARAQIYSVYINSYGDLLKRTRDLMPASELSNTAGAKTFIDTLERFGGLKGLDKTRPLAATMDFVPGPPGGPKRIPKIVLFIPVIRQTEFLGSLSGIGAEVQRGTRVKGYSSTIKAPAPTAPPFFVLDSPPAGYMVVANVPDSAANLRKIKPASFKPTRPSQLSVSMRLDRMPAESKKWFLDEIARRNEVTSERRPGESEERYQGRLVGTEMSLKAFERLAQDVHNLTFSLEPSTKSGKLVANFDIEARSGTTTGEAFDGFRRHVSRFSGLAPDAAFSMGGVLPLPRDFRQLAVDAFEKDRAKALKRKDATTVPLALLLIDSFKNVFSQDVLDGHFTLDAMSKGKEAMILIAAFKDAKKVESSLRELVSKKTTNGDSLPASLDAERGPDGISIHKFTNVSEAQGTSGKKDQTIYAAAFLQDSVILGGGTGVIEMIKSELGSLNRPTSKDDVKFVLNTALSRLLETDFMGGSEMRDVSRKIFSGANAKKDRVSLSLRGGEHRLTLRLEADPPVVAFAIALQNSGGSPLERAREFLGRGLYAEAIAELDQANKQNPRDPKICNLLAWTLATAPDATYRDGKRAVELATLACELTEWKVVSTIDTLAAALAEAGKFDEAIKRQEEALKLVNGEELRVEFDGRLKLYKERKPFHETAPSQDSAERQLERGVDLLNRGSYVEAIAELQQAQKRIPRNWHACNMLAWALATAPDAKLRDGKRAVELATQACELTKWKVYRTLDTLAAALAEAGKFDEAVKRQEEALKLLDDNRFRGEYEQRLNLYKARKPFHFRSEKPLAA